MSLEKYHPSVSDHHFMAILLLKDLSHTHFSTNVYGFVSVVCVRAYSNQDVHGNKVKLWSSERHEVRQRKCLGHICGVESGSASQWTQHNVHRHLSILALLAIERTVVKSSKRHRIGNTWSDIIILKKEEQIE